MSLIALAWLFTVGVLVHNAEEALYLPAWSAGAGRWQVRVGAAEFRFAVAALSVALVGLAAAASVSGPRSVAAYLFSGYVLAMAVNALVPHLAASVALRGYMPGTASGLLLNLPLGGLFLERALAQDYIRLGVFVWAGPAVALTIAASIPLLFGIGRRVGL